MLRVHAAGACLRLLRPMPGRRRCPGLCRFGHQDGSV